MYVLFENEWCNRCGLGALGGLCRIGDARQFMDAAVDIVETKNRGNIALVLISNGEVIGEHYKGIQGEIGRDTMFQTASMSKWLTANGVMKLVQDGSLDLDRPIVDSLTRWQLPLMQMVKWRPCINMPPKEPPGSPLPQRT